MKELYKRILSILLILILTLLFIKPTLSKINFGIDLQGGFEILYKIKPLTETDKLEKKDFDNTYKAIVNRIDSLGVSEPVINFEGENLIRIQLPGVSNEEEARKRISTTAVLSFRDSEDNLLMTSEILGKNGASLSQNEKTFYYQVKLDIKDTEKFYEVTNDISSRQDNLMAIWLDFDPLTDSYAKEKENCGKENSKCISAPYVNEALSGAVVIDGTFTKESASELVDLINSGSLPTKLVEESTPRSVSATFGESTINKTAIAGLITLIVISLILIFRYRISGILGSICLLIYSLLVFVVFNLFDGVLTLIGIAALILGIGMAVDSIIILSERIKDELLSGKKLNQAFKDGSKNSIIAIVDANVTTFIAGIVLYIFGESTIKGFATMLMITIIITILTTVLLYRVFLKWFVDTKAFVNKEELLLGKIKKYKSNNYNKISKYFIYSSLSILAIGVAFIFINGFNFGVDFSGGTNIVLSSKEKINFEEVLPIVSDYDIDSYDLYSNNDKEGYIKLENILTENEELEIQNKLKELGVETSLNEVSNFVTKTLTENAIKSLIFSLLAIILYIALRFNYNFAVSSILMLIHDVLMVLAVFIIFNIEINFILVAALLTIIGYSINDTIVVFDRIRYNRKKIYPKKKKLTENELINILNVSSNETIVRNIWTSVTTAIAVIGLLCVNLATIYTFNIAILVGLIAGTISSLLIGSKLYITLEIRSNKKPEEKDDEPKELLIKGINS